MTTAFSSLTSGRLLARSALWNFLGMAAPMLLALVAIPLLIEGMGKERFGLLAIIWMGVGYFSLFDMGLGRALTKMVSERLGRGTNDDLGALVWTALILLATLGVVGAALLLVFSDALVTRLLNVPADLQSEGVAAFRILAIGLPLVILNAGVVGLLEAHQRFGTITAIRVPLGVLTFGGPLVTLQFTPSIVWATAVLLVGRVIALSLYYRAATGVRTELRKPPHFDRTQIRPLLAFGGWLTVTNIIGPLMTYMDRFVIGAFLSLTAVTYYVTPYEILSRMQMFPQAIMGVMFPAMAAVYGAGQNRMVQLYKHSSQVIYWAMLPIIAGCFLFAPEALLLWLGEDFQLAATPVVYWLAVGWVINVLARPAFTVLQSVGRPDLVAKTHLSESVPYFMILWWLTARYGISGVAAAWTLRVVADTLILNVIAAYRLPELKPQVARAFLTLALTVIIFLGFWLLESVFVRLLALFGVVTISTAALWPLFRRVLKPGSPVAPLNSPDH